MLFVDDVGRLGFPLSLLSLTLEVALRLEPSVAQTDLELAGVKVRICLAIHGRGLAGRDSPLPEGLAAGGGQEDDHERNEETRCPHQKPPLETNERAYIAARVLLSVRGCADFLSEECYVVLNLFRLNKL